MRHNYFIWIICYTYVRSMTVGTRLISPSILFKFRKLFVTIGPMRAEKFFNNETAPPLEMFELEMKRQPLMYNNILKYNIVPWTLLCYLITVPFNSSRVNHFCHVHIKKKKKRKKNVIYSYNSRLGIYSFNVLLYGKFFKCHYKIIILNTLKVPRTF